MFCINTKKNLAYKQNDMSYTFLLSLDNLNTLYTFYIYLNSLFSTHQLVSYTLNFYFQCFFQKMIKNFFL